MPELSVRNLWYSALALLPVLMLSCGDPSSLLMNEFEDKTTELQLPAGVDGKTFLQWRDARRGAVQTELQNNPYWTWILQSETSAFLANQHFGGPSSHGGQAAWEADRFGQSSTLLPDGREILIAGEHEDYYDPDFFIYNDVIVQHTDGTIDFYGYPTDAFPPTDFHSATLLDDQIIIIGNLGYEDDRRPGTTPILILDTESLIVSKQLSTGDNPGWIHGHKATLTRDRRSIVITGGTVLPLEPEKPLLENIDDWQLHLADWRWERLTKRDWPLFEVKRADDNPNRIWEMRQGIWHLEHGSIDLTKAFEEMGEELDAETLETLQTATDYPVPNDPALLENLYRPDKLSYTVLPDRDDDDEFNVHRIAVDGVTIRYVESSYNILITVEGELPDGSISAIVDDLTEKLSKLEETGYMANQLRP